MLLAVAVFFAGHFVPEASAGYPVQPSDGKVVNTLNVSFLVAYPRQELSPRVYVSRSNLLSYDGSLFLNSGYVGSCIPATPFGEPEKFTCVMKLSEGTYYWQFAYQKYECTTGPFPHCSYRTTVGPAWRIDVKLSIAQLPTSVPIMGGPSTRSRMDPLYSKIARQISEKPAARVFCWSAADWNSIHVRKREERGEGLEWVLGYVMRGGTDINLAPEVCNRLDLIAYKRKRPTGSARRDFAEAVDTLAHEAVHVAGFTDEAVTECYSLQLIDFVSGKLGTNNAYARSMSLQAWNVLYRVIPEEYTTPDCFNDGPLDLYPDLNIWP